MAESQPRPDQSGVRGSTVETGWPGATAVPPNSPPATIVMGTSRLIGL